MPFLKIWHFMPTSPERFWKRFACWVSPCTTQIAPNAWNTQRRRCASRYCGQRPNGRCMRRCDLPSLRPERPYMSARFHTGTDRVTWSSRASGECATRPVECSDRSKSSAGDHNSPPMNAHAYRPSLTVHCSHSEPYDKKQYAPALDLVMQPDMHSVERTHGAIAGRHERLSNETMN